MRQNKRESERKQIEKLKIEEEEKMSELDLLRLFILRRHTTPSFIFIVLQGLVLLRRGGHRRRAALRRERVFDLRFVEHD